uniref:Acetyl-CoA C-acetyltransferase n=1 Tax=Rhizophora mucronata TaxID=61149 RepID=A0A2P2MCH8_RHIMU
MIICTYFSTISHSKIIINIPQAIFHHSINKCIMAKSRSLPAYND